MKSTSEGGEELNRNEMEVLRVLFEEAPLRPAEIEEGFGWEIENATLRSVLRGMVERGLLRRRKVGKAYYYRPARTASTMRRGLINRIAEVFSGGSRLGLIAQLIKDEKLSPNQVKELEDIITDQDQEDGAKGGENN